MVANNDLRMKKLSLLAVSLFFCQQWFAQQLNTDHKGLIDKEMKSFTQKMTAYNVNPNTLNYDLLYQRMEVSLDPAVYNISGSVTSHFKPSQSMNSIYFDLANTLTVSQVQYHGTNLTFQQLATKEVKINFPGLASG
ncbi:UNVERIFIED_CONTAM: hypothetical protein QE387_003885 [Pseudacidovorax intermedius]|nr:hypothetical protein [Pseudacidovorax intermedius]